MRDETGVGATPKGGRAASNSFGDGTKTVEKERAEAFETATGAEVDKGVFLGGKHKTGKLGRLGKIAFLGKAGNAGKLRKAGDRELGESTTQGSA